MSIKRTCMFMFLLLAATGANASQCVYTHAIYDYFDNYGYSFTASEIVSINCSAVAHNVNVQMEDPMLLGSVGDVVFDEEDVTDVPSPVDIEREVTATCGSSYNDRYLHATQDIQVENAARFGRFEGVIKGFVRITYQGGGSEVWFVAYPRSGDPLNQGEPVPNTRRCSE